MYVLKYLFLIKYKSSIRSDQTNDLFFQRGFVLTTLIHDGVIQFKES